MTIRESGKISSDELDARCVLCDSNHWIPIYFLGKYRIIKCRTCGLSKTDPFSNSDQLYEINESIYTIENRKRVYSFQINDLIKRYHRQLREIDEAKLNSGNQLLDVGCSLGFFLNIAKEEGYQVAGVEVSEVSAHYAKEVYDLDVVIGSLFDGNFPKKRFDVITMWDVLEHIPNPIEFLYEARRILNDDGILVIQSPNMDSFMTNVTKEYWNWWTVPDHLYHYNPTTLRRMLEKCGFRILSVYTWEPPKDLLMNLLYAFTPIHYVRSEMFHKAAKKLIYLISLLAWPIVLPIQKKQWKRYKGGLVVVYASINS